MSDKRNPVYFKIGALAAFLKLNLDPDLYNAATKTRVGAEATEPATGVIIPINIKYALASGVVKRFIAKVKKGTGDAEKTRDVPILVHSLKADTIATTDKPATLNLGQGATPQVWEVIVVGTKN